MYRALITIVAVVLSGAVSLAASLSLCEPMPCCVNQLAAIVAVSQDCCGVLATPDEQPRKLDAKRSIDPDVRAVPLTPLRKNSAVCITVTGSEVDASPPPSTRQRLSTLSILLI